VTAVRVAVEADNDEQREFDVPMPSAVGRARTMSRSAPTIVSRVSRAADEMPLMTERAAQAAAAGRTIRLGTRCSERSTLATGAEHRAVYPLS
jgi:hypothetical protein